VAGGIVRALVVLAVRTFAGTNTQIENDDEDDFMQPASWLLAPPRHAAGGHSSERSNSFTEALPTRRKT
jgi:hypothetical protein